MLAACAPVVIPAGPALAPPELAADSLVMADGARLPLHAWLPEAPPHAVVLAVHGFGDTARNAFRMAAPLFNAGGVALYAYDQRGFGEAPNWPLWPGAETLETDLAAASRLLRRRYPGLPLY
ncbi:alpha/beta hydrolase, partial [Roseomonas sp. TAS13]